MSFNTMLNFYRLRRNLSLKPSQLRELQDHKLREIVFHAYHNIPFYHRKFEEAHIRPEDIRKAEDLEKIPITTKGELQAAPLNDVVARDMNPANFIKRMTSGSTGIPLTLVVNREVEDFERASLARAYIESGLKIWYKMIRIADPKDFPKKQNPYQYLGLMRTKYISTFDDVEKQAAIIEDYKADVIRGFASYLERLAYFCGESGRNLRPKLIFTSAELLDKRTRELIESVFQTKLFDLYISEEFGLMGWECREHSGYHLNVEGVLPEFVNSDGEVVQPGERGELVCTNLVNRAMPLIRYNIGDIGMNVVEQCDCGKPLPLIKLIEGRTGDFLVTPDGRIIPPTMFFPYPFENVESIRQFKIIQEARDRLTIQLAPKHGSAIDDQVMERAREKIQQLFGGEMQVDFQMVESIERDPTGKLRKIVSHVPARMT